MTTEMDALFPANLTTTRRIYLIDTATEIFAEQGTGPASNDILVPAQDSPELLKRVCHKWKVNVQPADDSVTITAELKVHAALEERVTNPTEEPPAGGPTGRPLINSGPLVPLPVEGSPPLPISSSMPYTTHCTQYGG